MGVEGSKFNVCVTAGPDAPDMLFRFKIKNGDVTVGEVIDAVTDEIQAGLGDEHYDYEWDGEVIGLVPYFGDDWDNLPEGPLATISFICAQATDTVPTTFEPRRLYDGANKE